MGISYRFSFLLATLFLFLVGSTAQIKVTGRVIDSKSKQPLPMATITIQTEGGQPRAQSSDAEGNFTFTHVKSGKYTVKAVFLGYTTMEKAITVAESDVNVGTLRMKPEDMEIEEVKAVGTMVRQEQKGDTTVFNAAAFKVNPDATTEDLLKKMPGMQVKDGEVTQGGEKVKRVLVDGKEFFGSDPMLALKNIDASMVDKIEVYDRQSDQSQFTGFSDGNEERTINIMTKMGIKSGRFGRVYGGYGTDDHYEAGGNMNYFNGQHRMTVLAMLNNINQQNFSFDDVTGAMANGGGRGMRGGGRDGINTTGALGLNYNYEQENKIKIESSYFYNYNKNKTGSTVSQEYFKTDDTDSLHTYFSESGSNSHNYNHRANLRLTWTINEDNSLVFNPSVSWQKYDQTSSDWGKDWLEDLNYQSTTQDNDNDTRGYGLNGDLTWRHRFNKPMRTVSIRVGGSVNNSDSEGSSKASQDYVKTPSRNIKTSQLSDNESKSWKLNSRIMYTEPLGENAALQINYSPSYSFSSADKSVSADTVASTVDNPDFSNYRFSSILSNQKESEYLQHRAGVGLNVFQGKDFRATVTFDYQKSILDGDQTYPTSFETHKTFNSFMPSAELRFSKQKAMNIRLTYRTNSSAPSINQLQKVIDVSNIRRYSSGNDDLSQSTTHQLRLFFTANNVETSRFMFFIADVSTTKDNITTSSVIATKDSLLENGIILPKGTEFNKPINMDGQVSARTNITLSSPVKWLGSNVSLNLGANLQKRPSMYNYKEVTNKTYAVSGGLNIGSSFSENVDFNIGYDASYNIVKSSQTASSNYNYYRHGISADLTCLFINQRFVFNNNLRHNYTSGMGENYDQNYISWNASLAVKVLKDKRGEIKLRVNDLLDTSESVSRSIGDASIRTSTNDVLRRFAMLTFTYKFKTIGEMPQTPQGPWGGGGGRLGGRPGGGPGGFGGGRR